MRKRKREKEKERERKEATSALSYRKRKPDEKLVGVILLYKSCSPPIICNRTSALLVLVQHELIVFARSSFGYLAHLFGCTSPIIVACVFV